MILLSTKEFRRTQLVKSLSVFISKILSVEQSVVGSVDVEA